MKTIKKKNKRTLTPKLRFPEFRNGLGWKERPLLKVLSEHGQKSAGAEQVFSVSVHKGLVNQIEHLGRSFSASSTDHYNRVLPGDIVYTKSPTGDFPFGVVKQSKLDFPVVVSPLYGVFSPETTGLGAILDAYFESPANTKLFLEPLIQKGAKNTINIKNDRFLSGTLILPVNKEEQRKIGDFLTSIDELIAAEGRTLDALRAHKKGLMQQLFPQPGQTKPRLRFPEFRDKGEWQATTVWGAAKTITPPKRLLTSEYGDEGRFPIVDQSPTPDCGRTDDADAILTKGLPFTIFGDHTCVVKFVDQPFAQGADGIKILKARSIIDDLFLYFSLQARSLSSTQYKRHFTTLKEQELVYPDVKTGEQQRITACLTALETRIAVQAEKIESLKQHKRGLMQQLFPAPEEQ